MYDVVGFSSSHTFFHYHESKDVACYAVSFGKVLTATTMAFSGFGSGLYIHAMMRLMGILMLRMVNNPLDLVELARFVSILNCLESLWTELCFYVFTRNKITEIIDAAITMDAHHIINAARFLIRGHNAD